MRFAGLYERGLPYASFLESQGLGQAPHPIQGLLLPALETVTTARRRASLPGRTELVF